MNGQRGASRAATLGIVAAVVIVLTGCGYMWYRSMVREGREDEMARTAKAFNSSNEEMTTIWGDLADQEKTYQEIDDGMWGAWISGNDAGLGTFASKAGKELVKRRKTLDCAGDEVRARKQLISEMDEAAQGIGTAPGLPDSDMKAANAAVETARETNRLDEELYDLKRQLADIDKTMLAAYNDYLAGKKSEEETSAVLKEAVARHGEMDAKADKVSASRIGKAESFPANWREAS